MRRRACGVEQHVGQVDDQAAGRLARVEDDVQLRPELLSQHRLVLLGLRRGALRLSCLRFGCLLRRLRLRSRRFGRRPCGIGIGGCTLRRRLPGGGRPGVQLRGGACRGVRLGLALRCLGLALRQVTSGSCRLRIELGLPASRGLGLREIERVLLAREGPRLLRGHERLFLPLQPNQPGVFRRLRGLPGRHHHGVSALLLLSGRFSRGQQSRGLVEGLLRVAIGARQTCQFHRVPRLGQVQR